MAKDQLQKRLIDPIMAHCPPELPVDLFLKATFSTHQRALEMYKAVRRTSIPGLYCVNGCIPTQGLGDEYRQLMCHKKVLVRHDITQPNTYHIDRKGHVFQLTEEQWLKLKEDLILTKDGEEI